MNAQDYATFLEAKAQMADGSGFEPLWIPDFLFDFQKHLVTWAIRQGRAAIFADCVAGETLIEGPDGNERVDVLAARGQPIRVWALDRSGHRVVAHATAPYVRGQAALSRFALASGRAITVAEHHRFLTPEGWVSANALGVGSLLAVGHSPSCADTLAASSLGHARQALSGGAHYYDQTPPGWRGRYSGDHHRGGARPLPDQDSAPAFSPSQGDALAHALPLSHRGDQERRREYNHQHPRTDRPSKRDYLPLDDCVATDVVSPPRSSACISVAVSTRTSVPDPLGAIRLRSTVESHPLAVQSCERDPLACAYSFDTVVSIHYIRNDDYYDLHVPIHENYLANGLWNHNCGLGKTPMQLVWAENMRRKTGRPVLILTPLAVAFQTRREAEKFGIDVAISRDGHVAGGITVANYERLHLFDRHDFGAVVCDESSAIKAFDGVTRSLVTAFMRHIPYRLLCTATAAPNDYIELGTSSEALGYLGHMDMLNRFFVNKEKSTAMSDSYRRGQVGHATEPQWRFKGHAEDAFWRWVSSWARAMRQPSDFGYSDRGFALPPLVLRQHTVTTATPPTGMLFDLPAINLQEQRDEQRRSLAERCALVADLLADAESAVAWCQLNSEGDLLTKSIAGAVQVSGSDSTDRKEEVLQAFAEGQIRVLVTKPSIGAWGLNLQNCHRMSYFPSHSYEQYYQAVRRSWRFGQTQSVIVDVVSTEGGTHILQNLQRKAQQADRMFDALVSHMNEALSITRSVSFTKPLEVPLWMS